VKNLKKIMRTIQSFRDSTYKIVSLKNESFYCDSMNSPYVSHQEIKIKSGHGREKLIIIESHDIMFLSTDYQDRKNKNDGQCWKEIPAYWVRQILNETNLFPFGLPEWLKEHTVWAIIPDRFRGYDDKGKPIWDNRRAKITPIRYSEEEFSLGFEFTDTSKEEEDKLYANDCR